MKLDEFMIRDVVQIAPADSVAEAATRMRDRGVGCLLVAIESVVKGIITDRDLLGCIAERHDAARCAVEAHMSRPVVVLKPEEDHLTAVEVMRKRRIKRLPVAKAGKIVGIVSLSDLAALAESDLERLEHASLFIAALIKTQRAQERLPKSSSAAPKELPRAAAGGL